MSHQSETRIGNTDYYKQRSFQETVELERQREEFHREREQFEEEQRFFERKKREFRFKKERDEKQLEQRERLLNMKLQILEEEYRKLAKEREQVEHQKQYYRREEEQREKSRCGVLPADGQEELFFGGVGSELALKKRYKDLIKIYHPDNLAGDTQTIQVINREYERLKKAFM